MLDQTPEPIADPSAEPRPSDRGSIACTIAALLGRSAACLAAILRTPTASSGLNESRFHVLDALRRMPDGTSTQAALAVALLQSESNLSTLLERMHHDGLISRIRSTADRRKSLIGLTTDGSDALMQADHERDRAVAKILRLLAEQRTRDLRETLEQLLIQLELELGIRSPSESPATALQDTEVPSEDVLRPPHWQLARSSNFADISAPHDGNQL